MFKDSARYIPDGTTRSIDAALGWIPHADESAIDVIFRFEHGLGKISLAHYLVRELPDAQDIAETMGATDSLDKNLEYLLRRCVARFGALAEKSETAFGFTPLEVPAEVQTLQERD